MHRMQLDRAAQIALPTCASSIALCLSSLRLVANSRGALAKLRLQKICKRYANTLKIW